MTNKVIADVLAPLEESVNTVISSLDGKNQNFFGPDTPPTEGLKANDIWYKTIGEGEVEMLSLRRYTMEFNYSSKLWRCY